MDIEQKRERVWRYCNDQKSCKMCCLATGEWKKCNTHGCFCIVEADEDELDRALDIIGKKVSRGGDSVEHPSHYNCGTIEVWDFIADWELNFDRGNAIKYICRAGSKDPTKEIQDLEKAIQYINHEIKMLKGEWETDDE